MIAFGEKSISCSDNRCAYMFMHTHIHDYPCCDQFVGRLSNHLGVRHLYAVTSANQKASIETNIILWNLYYAKHLCVCGVYSRKAREFWGDICKYCNPSLPSYGDDSSSCMITFCHRHGTFCMQSRTKTGFEPKILATAYVSCDLCTFLTTFAVRSDLPPTSE